MWRWAIVAALAERIKNAGSGILVDYKGITVEEDTALRTEMRKESVNYSVVKNTLTRKALDSLGMEGLDHVLNGTTSLATTESDPIAPFRIITDYSKKLGDRFNVKAAFMEGKILSEQEITEISALPAGNRRNFRAARQGCSVCEGAGHYDRSNHRSRRLPRPDSGTEGWLC